MRKAGPALRLGLNRIKGLAERAAERVVSARHGGAFMSVPELAERAQLGRADLDVLAGGGALATLARNRHRAHWDAAGIEKPAPLLGRPRIAEGIPMLRAPTEGEEVLADYRRLGLSLRRHPLALLRGRLTSLGMRTAGQVQRLSHGALAHASGLVITRQRPSSASGVIFVTIEDETGYLNLVVWERVAERQRQILSGATLLGVSGAVQREGEVVHIVARRLHDYSALLGELPTQSRDFH